MPEQNPATKLANDIVANFLQEWPITASEGPIATVEKQLQPTFDLLKQIHALAKEARQFSFHYTHQYTVFKEIEKLTCKYDTEAKENQNDEALH